MAYPENADENHCGYGGIECSAVLFHLSHVLWSDRAPAVKEAKAGSAAERYLRNFETEDYYCGNFIESMNDYIGAKTDGTEMKAYHIESMVRHGFYLAQQIYDDKMGAEEKEEAAALLDAFLQNMSDCRRNTAIFTGRKNGVPATMNSARHQGMPRFPGSVKRRAWTDGIYHFLAAIIAFYVYAGKNGRTKPKDGLR